MVTAGTESLSFLLQAIEQGNSASLVSAIQQVGSNALNGGSYLFGLLGSNFLSGLGLSLATNKSNGSNSCKDQ